jgi:hypothetical protein
MVGVVASGCAEAGPDAPRELGRAALAVGNGNGGGNGNGNGGGNGNGNGNGGGNGNGNGNNPNDSGVADAGGVGHDAGQPVGGPPHASIDIRRSLVVTEQPILERFAFERVMAQLAAQSGVPGVTALSLFQQLWDTQNPGPGLGLGPHCDDVTDDTYGPVINGYPYQCRPGSEQEGGEAACDPFVENSPCAYIPIALFNRFDLAPLSGDNCGEHRVVYARASGRTDSRARNLVIFETALPNPHPVQGLKGCKKIVDFWGDLTAEDDMLARADALEAFYFDGIANVPPVISFDHLGNQAGGYGQIRTNQFIQPLTISPRVWSLREFKLRKECADGACTVASVPVTNKTNPFGPLFNAAWVDPNAPAFQEYFITQVADLASDNIRMDIPEVYNSALSEASAGATQTNYAFNFGTADNPFRDAIEAELLALGSTLTPDDIVARAQTQSCAGCHRLSNNRDLGGGKVFPSSLGFTHVSERDVDLEVVDGVTRYKISEALETTFLPARKAVLEDYINNPPPNSQSQRSVGGRTTH